jgi:hypothetical protein
MRVAALALGIAGARAAAAQTPLHGRVLAKESGQPLQLARVVALRAGVAAETDRDGRFVLWVATLPDTLVARLIGRVPDTVVVTGSQAVELRLAVSPLPVGAIAVYGDSGTRGSEAFPSRWALPREAMAAVPSAVEGDVLRALALSPAVSYSSPLSAQPFVRGADPGAVSIRLDGFALINPYHVGRVFGAVLPEATQSASVLAAPFAEEWGDATSAVVDVQLREGSDSLRGGAQLSFVSAAAWVGGSIGQQRWFFGWRHGWLEHVSRGFPDAPVYRLDDFYGRLGLGAHGRSAQVTLFASRDDLSAKVGDAGMRWGNLLVGVRVPWELGSTLRVEAWGEASRYHQDVVAIPIRDEDTDVRNRYATVAAGLRGDWTGRRTALSAGLELRYRGLENRISGGSRGAPSSTASGVVGSAFAGIGSSWGRLSVHLGSRLDADGAVTAFQPRARASWMLNDRWSLALGVGRTAKLYQVIADYQPDLVDLVFYDLWRPAGRDRTPTPVADHAVLELRRAAARGVGLRAAAFVGSLGGTGEVRPYVVDSSLSSFFRFGRGRVAGLELEASSAGTRHSISASYVLSSSRRTWDGDEFAIPWMHDRRHQARAFMAWLPGHGWRFHWLAEVSSPEPLTPVLGTFSPGTLLPGPAGVTKEPPGYLGRTIALGRENTGRDRWVGHLDLGFQKEVGGPGRSVGRIGITVLNAAFTRIGTSVPEFGEDGSLVYKPRIYLPPVPTLTFNLEF